MSRIHILTPSTVPGDAISNDVRNASLVSPAGVPDLDLCRHLSRRFAEQVRPLLRLSAVSGQSRGHLIYHHSVGWPAGLALYRRSRNRKWIKYHNVTRPIYFRPYNANYVRNCLRGERETRRLVQCGRSCI